MSLWQLIFLLTSTRKRVSDVCCLCRMLVRTHVDTFLFANICHGHNRVVLPTFECHVHAGALSERKQAQLPDEARLDPCLWAVGYVRPNALGAFLPETKNNCFVPEKKLMGKASREGFWHLDFATNFFLTWCIFLGKCLISGAYNCAIGIYNTMAIKNVQHDTMSHFITDRATTFGLFNEALTQLYGAHEIYHSNEAEVPRQKKRENLQMFWTAWFLLFAQFSWYMCINDFSPFLCSFLIF